METLIWQHPLDVTVAL